jgi:hypothetical protein
MAYITREAHGFAPLAIRSYLALHRRVVPCVRREFINDIVIELLLHLKRLM